MTGAQRYYGWQLSRFNDGYKMTRPTPCEKIEIRNLYFWERIKYAIKIWLREASESPYRKPKANREGRG